MLPASWLSFYPVAFCLVAGDHSYSYESTLSPAANQCGKLFISLSVYVVEIDWSNLSLPIDRHTTSDHDHSIHQCTHTHTVSSRPVPGHTSRYRQLSGRGKQITTFLLQPLFAPWKCPNSPRAPPLFFHMLVLFFLVRSFDCCGFVLHRGLSMRKIVLRTRVCTAAAIFLFFFFVFALLLLSTSCARIPEVKNRSRFTPNAPQHLWRSIWFTFVCIWCALGWLFIMFLTLYPSSSISGIEAWAPAPHR